MEGMEPLNDVVAAALVSRRPNQLRQSDPPVNPG